jgi:HK97 family phage portal protein
MVAWALSWGNGYAEIEWDLAGRPIALHPISPDRVQVKRGKIINEGFIADLTGEIYYQVYNYLGGSTYLHASDVFHLHGLGFDGLIGYSIISLAARSLGMTIATEQYAEDFFSNGLVSTGGLKHPKTLSEPAYDRLKKWIKQKTGFGHKWEPPIFEEGMEWQPMSIAPEEAQMLETRKLQVTDVARWFGLPPHKLADLDRATFSNIEQQSIEVVNDCFMPWIHRLEEEADFKLFSGREQGIRTKINPRGLLRGDDAARATYYKTMHDIGVYSTNTILRLEDLDPVGPEGDELLVPLNYTTLKKLVSSNEPAPSTSPALPAPSPDQVQKSYLVLLQDAFERILRRELNRFDQSRHKFSENGAFLEWIEALFGQQREYMKSALEPILTSMALLCIPHARINGNFTAIISAAIDGHMERTRNAFELVISSNAQFEMKSRARQEARDLIERAFALLIQENSHALPQ